MDNVQSSLQQRLAAAAAQAPPEYKPLLEEAQREIGRLAYVPGKTYIECPRSEWLNASREIERAVEAGDGKCYVLGKTMLITQLQAGR